MAIKRLGIFVFILFISCAYFNTFYNAKTYFNEAERTYKERGNTSESLKKYRKVIEKCSKVLDRYPKSKYVDDALYLMALSYMRIGEKQKAKRKFEELFTFYPHTRYKNKALLDYASLLVSLGMYDSAKSVIEHINTKKKDEVRLVLSKLAFKEGNYNALVKMGRNMLKNRNIDEKSQEFLNLATLAAIKIDSLDAAQRFLSSLRKINLTPSERFRVNTMYLDFLFKRREPDTALSVISSLRYPPESNESRILSLYKSKFLLLKGDTSSAKRTLMDIIKERRSDSLKTISTYELAKIFEEEGSLSKADSLYKSIMYSSYIPVAKKAREREEVMKDIIALKDSTDCRSLSRTAELYLFDLQRSGFAEKKYAEVFKRCDGIEKQRSFYALLYIALSKKDTTSALKWIRAYPCDSISDTLRSLVKQGLGLNIKCQAFDTTR